MDIFSTTSTTVLPEGTVTLTVNAHDPDCPGTCTSGCGLYIRSDLTFWSATGGSFTATDNGSPSSPYVATADWQAPTTEGTYTLSVSLSDSGSFLCGGREVSAASLDVLVTSSTNQPPVVDALSAAPTRLFPGQPSQLTCLASDPDGDPLTYAWATNLGTVTPAGDTAATLAASDPGIATVTCTVTDPEGASGSDSIQLVVSDAQASQVIDGVFSAPQRLAVDSMGDVYVVDGSGGLTVVNLFSGELVYRIRLPDIRSVAIDWADNLLIGRGSGALVLDRQGTVLALLGSVGGPGDVVDVAVDVANQRYGVLHRGAGRVTVYDAAGLLVGAFGSTGDAPEQFMSPQGLAATPAGEWVVADSGHGLVKTFDPAGNLLRSFGGLGGGGGEFIGLDDVSVDGRGVVFASDAFQDWVQSFNPDGSLREAFGTYGDGMGEFQTATGVTPVGDFDRLLVASLNGANLHVFVTSQDPVSGGQQPVATLSPSGLSFPAQAVGTPSSPQSVVLTNDGDAPLGLRAVAVSGDFAQVNDCGAFLDPDDSCSVSLTFRPAEPGTRQGTLALETSAAGSPHEVSLDGTGFVPAGVGFSTGRLAFDDQPVGTISEPQTVALSNGGTVDLEIYRVEVAGEFLQVNDCGPTLSGGASCLFTLYFTPLTIEDELLGSLTVESSAVGGPHSAELSGAGVAGSPAISIGDVTAAEGDSGASQAAFPLTLSVVHDEAISVDFATVDDTAVAGEDFEATSGTVAFAPGDTTATLQVPILGDLVLEPDEETFFVDLSNPVNAALGQDRSVAAIQDDELCPGPDLLFNAQAETWPAAGQLPGWTMVAGTDWQRRTYSPNALLGRAYFFAGTAETAELAQDVDLSAYADAIAGGEQRFAFEGYLRTADELPGDLARIVVEYRDAGNAVVLDAYDSGDVSSPFEWWRLRDVRTAPVGTGWIRVRLLGGRLGAGETNAYFDALSLRSLRVAALKIDDLWAYEGDKGASATSFTVDLPCPYYQDVAFEFASADGTATAGVDYLAAAGSGLLASGQVAEAVPLAVIGDDEDEDHEDLTMTLTLTAPADAVLLDDQALGVIVNDDFCPRGVEYWAALDPWPVEVLVIGDLEYGRRGLWFLLLGGEDWVAKDASGLLARELVATKFNLALGSDPVILPRVDEADALLTRYPPGTDGGARKQEVLLLTRELQTYNKPRCGPGGGGTLPEPIDPEDRDDLLDREGRG